MKRLLSVLALSLLTGGIANAQIVIPGAGQNGNDLIRPTDVIASSIWPNADSPNGNVLPAHLIQEPGTAAGGGSTVIDAALVDVNDEFSERWDSFHRADGGGTDFGQWHGIQGESDGYVMFDLGGQFDLTAVHLWNSNQTNNTNRGVNGFEILLTNDASAYALGEQGNPAWGTAVVSSNLAQAASGEPLAAETFPVTGTFRYVQVNILSNHGADFTGLSEFRVSAVPDGMVVLKGDVDLDGSVTFLDINPFIQLLASNGFQAEADCDCDGDLDFLDIQPFINILAGN